MKHILAILLLGASVLGAQVIPPPVTPPPDPAELVAKALVEGINGSLEQSIKTHKNLWETLWENHRATAPEIFAELGSRGAIVLLAGRAMVDHIEEAATLAGTTAEALLGDAKYLTTKHPVTVHQDGTVTVTMPED